jgi:hypothetical protein
VRVRANIEVSNPLIRFVPLNVGGVGRKMLQVKYDFFVTFVMSLVFSGHDMEECGDGFHTLEEVHYCKWMIAKRRAQVGWYGLRAHGRA